MYNTISDTLAGAFTSGTVLYGLAQGGVGLAPFHDAEAAIPLGVKTKLEMIRQGIIAGVVEVNGDCPWYVFLPGVLH